MPPIDLLPKIVDVECTQIAEFCKYHYGIWQGYRINLQIVTELAAHLFCL
jgi:hypothetical protein